MIAHCARHDELYYIQFSSSRRRCSIRASERELIGANIREFYNSLRVNLRFALLNSRAIIFSALFSR